MENHQCRNDGNSTRYYFDQANATLIDTTTTTTATTTPTTTTITTYEPDTTLDTSVITTQSQSATGDDGDDDDTDDTTELPLATGSTTGLQILGTTEMDSSDSDPSSSANQIFDVAALILCVVASLSALSFAMSM